METQNQDFSAYEAEADAIAVAWHGLVCELRRIHARLSAYRVANRSDEEAMLYLSLVTGEVESELRPEMVQLQLEVTRMLAYRGDEDGWSLA